jgi:hypothetical protein
MFPRKHYYLTYEFLLQKAWISPQSCPRDTKVHETFVGALSSVVEFFICSEVKFSLGEQA